MNILLQSFSNKKFKVSIIILSVGQLICFLISLVNFAFTKDNDISLRSTICLDENPSYNYDIDIQNNRWFDNDCNKRIYLEKENETAFDSNNLVYVTEIDIFGSYNSKWAHTNFGILDLYMTYQTEQTDTILDVTFDFRLAYGEYLNTYRWRKHANGIRWHAYMYGDARKQQMFCTFENKTGVEKKDYLYKCTVAPFFELYSIQYVHYLLNVRLPYNSTITDHTSAVRFQLIHVNNNFTKLWMGLKEFFVPIIVGIMVWFWYSIRRMNLRPTALQHMLIYVGGMLTFLDLPVEYLYLKLRIPWMGWVCDIYHGIFYTVLFCFWVVFAKEHTFDEDNNQKSRLSMYWKDLSMVAVGCCCLSAMYLYIRSNQVVDPYNGIWMTSVSTNLFLLFITLVCAFGSIYFIYLIYLIRRILKNISSGTLSKMSQARLLHYNGVTHRFKYIMWVTVVCATVSIVFFILSQTIKMYSKWNKINVVQSTSILYTSAYGMWNIYVCALLIFYAPSGLANLDCTENEEESKHLSAKRMSNVSKNVFVDNSVIKYLISKMTVSWNTLVNYWQVKGIQKFIQNDKAHSISEDIAKLMCEDVTKDTLIECTCVEGDKPISAHSFIIKCRSAELGNSLLMYEDVENENIQYKLDLADLSHGVVDELIRYIYTDNIEDPQKYSRELLPLGIKLHLPGLTEFCERYLVESLTPTNASDILLLAEKCGCNKLKKASLIYLTHSENVEENEGLLPN